MQNEFENTVIYELITKRLTGEITPPEEVQLNKWLNADKANRETYDSYHQTWEMSANLGELLGIDLETEWSRMESVMDQSKEKKEPVTVSSQSFRERNNFRAIYKVAAVILLLFIPAGLAYFFYGEQQVQWESHASILQRSLPDGTRISLFRNSTITYPESYLKNTRSVKLKGEAFFDVVPDEMHPFIVDAEEVNIKVLGTSFNVNTQKEGDLIEVIVQSGTVLVYTNSKTQQPLTLTAGERGIYHKKSKTLKEEANEDLNYNSWKTKKLQFRNKKFSQVIKTLNKVYDAHLNIESNALKKCRIAIDFEDQSLEEALEVLHGIVDFEITEKNGIKVITGEGC